MKMYKKSTINLLVSLAVGLEIVFSSAVWAKNPVTAVKNQDTNGDNKVSLSEWSKSPFIFKKIDFNGDGFITAEEFAKNGVFLCLVVAQVVEVLLMQGL
jgi:hypothetical protein